MVGRVVVGAGLLLGGAVLIDTGWWLGQPDLQRSGNAAVVLAGVGLAFLPAALGARSRPGRILYWAGTALASLVDVPAVIDPSDLRLGSVLGLPAMLLLSTGLVLLWREQRSPALLAAAVWFAIQLPVNLALFIGPTGRPSFVLQTIGVAAALTVAVLASSAHRRTAPTLARWSSGVAPVRRGAGRSVDPRRPRQDR